MKNKNISQSLEECKECSHHIMSDIKEVLDSNNLNYNMNSSETEITVNVSSEEIDIEKLIRDNLTIPNYMILLLLDIIVRKTSVVIRLKREDR